MSNIHVIFLKKPQPCVLKGKKRHVDISLNPSIVKTLSIPLIDKSLSFERTCVYIDLTAYLFSSLFPVICSPLHSRNPAEQPAHSECLINICQINE